MMMLHTVPTVEASFDGDEYDGRTFGISAFGVRVCLFLGRRHRITHVHGESLRADQLARAADEIGRRHGRRWTT